jgi:hypothetical protein
MKIALLLMEISLYLLHSYYFLFFNLCRCFKTLVVRLKLFDSFQAFLNSDKKVIEWQLSIFVKDFFKNSA